MLLPLLAGLQRRRVIRALIGYGVAAFAVLQSSSPSCTGCAGRRRCSRPWRRRWPSGSPGRDLAWTYEVDAGRIGRTPHAPTGELEGAGLSFVDMSPARDQEYFSD